MSLGLDNITNTSINSTAPGPSINQTTSRIGDLGPAVAGAPEYAGILMLLVFGAGLFKADAGLDVSAAVIIPTSLFLSLQGFLPTPDGIIYGVLIGISALLGFGVVKFAFR
jgi:hypothetical protein